MVAPPHIRGVDPHGKDCLYQWKFLPFGLKNALAKFQRVMDQMLAGLGFAKCYFDDIIVFSPTHEIICTICKRCLKDLRNISFI